MTKRKLIKYVDGLFDVIEKNIKYALNIDKRVKVLEDIMLYRIKKVMKDKEDDE